MRSSFLRAGVSARERASLYLFLSRAAARLFRSLRVSPARLALAAVRPVHSAQCLIPHRDIIRDISASFRGRFSNLAVASRRIDAARIENLDRFLFDVRAVPPLRSSHFANTREPTASRSFPPALRPPTRIFWISAYSAFAAGRCYRA